MSEKFTLTCWICGKFVRLEDVRPMTVDALSTTDCYVAITVATQAKSSDHRFLAEHARSAQ